MGDAKEVFIYDRKKAVLATFVGLFGCALMTWAAVTGRDFIVFQDNTARALTGATAALSAWLVVMNSYRALKPTVLVVADSEGLLVRGKFLTLRRVKWDALYFVEFPWKTPTTLRIRARNGIFALYYLTATDRLRFFQIMADRGVAVQTEEERRAS